MEIPFFTLSIPARIVFNASFYILTVDKQTVQTPHPGAQQRHFFHILFRNVAGETRAACIGDDNIEIASVVSDV